ncbi:Uncharacterised protein [Citrobacter freundii]|nr:Uncharacterised protein [Citrobacter freundii]
MLRPRPSLLWEAMVFWAFKEGKNVQVRAGNNMSDVVIDYLKSGHKIVPQEVNEMRVEVSKK